MPTTSHTYQPIPQEAAQIDRALLNSLAERTGRKDFLSTLAELLHPSCNFSWLTINIRDQREEMLADFSTPGKKQINPFAPVLPQSLTQTMAEYLQDTKGPLIISDCVEYFISASPPPIFQHSATSVIALPLPLNNEIFATMHLGYEAKPDNLYKVASFVGHICPAIAASLGVVLSSEAIRHDRLVVETQDFTPAVEVPFEASVVFRSQAMHDVVRQLSVLTNLDVPVLLLGETGTGKSMIARHIHHHSSRSAARFVRVNCPSLASSLFESEMFGHAKGSFTGATKNRIGRFELAHKGTLFLDEVAELSMDMQSKLLQVLDDSSFERVGESTPIMVDMRIVAATNVTIGEAIGEGRLRSDLFHRISVYTIELPPLRQRPDDIAPLARALSAQSAQKLNLADVVYTAPVLRALTEYHWPGNTRELNNLMTRLVINQNVHGELSGSLVQEIIAQSESFSQAGSGDRPPAPAHLEIPPPDQGGPLSTLAEMERKHIAQVLRQCGGLVSGPRGAAKILGLPRSTLLHRMRKLGIGNS